MRHPDNISLYPGVKSTRPSLHLSFQPVSLKPAWVGYGRWKVVDNKCAIFFFITLFSFWFRYYVTSSLETALCLCLISWPFPSPLHPWGGVNICPGWGLDNHASPLCVWVERNHHLLCSHWQYHYCTQISCTHTHPHTYLQVVCLIVMWYTLTPPLYLHLPDGSRRSGSWSMPTSIYSYTLSSSLNVLLLCNASFWSHDIYCFCPSWREILLCCSPEGFFPFFPVKGFFLFLGSFSWSDVRSKVRDVVCVQIVKPAEANL